VPFTHLDHRRSPSPRSASIHDGRGHPINFEYASSAKGGFSTIEKSPHGLSLSGRSGDFCLGGIYVTGQALPGRSCGKDTGVRRGAGHLERLRFQPSLLCRADAWAGGFELA